MPLLEQVKISVGRWLTQSPGNCHQSRDVPEAYEYSRLNWSLLTTDKKGKGSPYSITERMVPELIPVLGSQPAV